MSARSCVLAGLLLIFWDVEACVRHCSDNSKPCGDSCISKDLHCHKPPGNACYCRRSCGRGQQCGNLCIGRTQKCHLPKVFAACRPPLGAQEVVAGASRRTEGACSTDDIAKINALPNGTNAGSFASTTSYCGNYAFDNVSHHDNNTQFFLDCMAFQMGISAPCASCYTAASKHEIDDCDAECYLSWCSESCFNCTARQRTAAAKCSGYENPVSPCWPSLDADDRRARPAAAVAEAVSSSATGACSTEDIKKIQALPKGVNAGSLASTSAYCGDRAYDDVQYNPNKTEYFIDCMAHEIHISAPCAGCYAAVGQYKAKHCDLECYYSWCSWDCLFCVGNAQDTADQCAGYENPVTPCQPSQVTDDVPAAGDAVMLTKELASFMGSSHSALGACSTEDIEKIQALPNGTNAGSFASTSAYCGDHAYDNVTHHANNTQYFLDCMAYEVHVSAPCAGCYAAVGQHKAQQCDEDCYLSWCSPSCFNCIARAQSAADECSGYNSVVPPCQLEQPADELAARLKELELRKAKLQKELVLLDLDMLATQAW